MIYINLLLIFMIKKIILSYLEIINIQYYLCYLCYKL